MLFVPSPATLVHSAPRRPSLDISLQSELHDLFACAPPNSSAIVSPYSSYSTDVLCYLSSLALNNSFPDIALFFYEEAAARGSVVALNAAYFVVDGFLNFVSIPNGPLFQRARVCNRRALERGSLDARRHRARYCDFQQKFAQALAYNVSHYQGTLSLLSAMEIAKTTRLARSPVPDVPISTSLLRYCIASGHSPAIPELISLLNSTKDDSPFWKKVSEKCLPPLPHLPILKASLKFDTSTVLCQFVSDLVLKFNEPFTDPPPDFRSSVSHGIPRLRLKVDGSGDVSFLRSAPFPTASPTVELIQLFELCCPEFPSRNLELAKLLLFHLYQGKPLGILESHF
jgi:hypothetical protein